MYKIYKILKNKLQNQFSCAKINSIVINTILLGDVDMNDIFSQASSMDITGGKASGETLITKDTVLVGTIAADSSIYIDGGIKGDVFSKNSIQLTGKVDGNMKANDVTITDGAVKGDISSEGNIHVSGNSVIVGNLNGKSLEFNGKIKGSVHINGHAIIRENAVIHGNLSACNFTVDDGAKIIGFVEIIRPTETTGAPTEKIEDIVDFNDIEIPVDAGTPDKSDNVAAPTPAEAAPVSTPLFETVSAAKEEAVEAPVVEPVAPVEAPPAPPALELEIEADEVVAEEEEVTDEKEDGGDSFVDEKQKMLQDLRSRMEKAKKSGQSL